MPHFFRHMPNGRSFACMVCFGRRGLASAVSSSRRIRASQQKFCSCAIPISQAGTCPAVVSIRANRRRPPRYAKCARKQVSNVWNRRDCMASISNATAVITSRFISPPHTATIWRSRAGFRDRRIGFLSVRRFAQRHEPGDAGADRGNFRGQARDRYLVRGLPGWGRDVRRIPSWLISRSFSRHKRRPTRP